MSSLSIAAYFPFARSRVVSQTVHLDAQPAGTLIRIQPDRRFRPVCRTCGAKGIVQAPRRHIDRVLGSQNQRPLRQRTAGRSPCPVVQDQLGPPEPSFTHNLQDHFTLTRTYIKVEEYDLLPGAQHEAVFAEGHDH